MKVLLVTSEGACGIAEHSALLKAAVEAADPTIEIVANAEALDPMEVSLHGYDLVHLNYQAALHSRWRPDQIEYSRREFKIPFVLTYHDTGVPNSDQCKALHAVADAFVVHEPAEDLPGAIYWRQGVPAMQPRVVYGADASFRGGALALPVQPNRDFCFKQYSAQPVLGTVGFPFPWKNYDLLATVTAAAGWALVLLAPTATPAQVSSWQRANPYTLVRTDFVPREAVVAHLAGCDASAFLYTCANTGTSGAIRQGLAARKPVLAAPPGVCRQFRDLALAYGDPSTRSSPITWVVPEPDRLVLALRQLAIGRVDPNVAFVAEQDSWARLGARYAGLYRKLHEGR